MGDLSEKIVEKIDKLENNDLIKVLEGIIPKFGFAFQSFISLKNKIFIEEIKTLEHKKFKGKLENPCFIPTFINIYEACRRSKEDEKSRFFCKFFRTIVEKEINNKSEFDELEEFIYLFSTLSFREILALHKIREFTKANEENRISKNNIIIKVLSDWDNEVGNFLHRKLEVDFDDDIFLFKLERTGLIVKNLNEKQGFIYSKEKKRHVKESELDTIKINSYISTSYFEKLYVLSDSLEKYLDECCKHTN